MAEAPTETRRAQTRRSSQPLTWMARSCRDARKWRSLRAPASQCPGFLVPAPPTGRGRASSDLWPCPRARLRGAIRRYRKAQIEIVRALPQGTDIDHVAILGEKHDVGAANGDIAYRIAKAGPPQLAGPSIWSCCVACIGACGFQHCGNASTMRSISTTKRPDQMITVLTYLDAEATNSWS